MVTALLRGKNILKVALEMALGKCDKINGYFVILELALPNSDRQRLSTALYNYSTATVNTRLVLLPIVYSRFCCHFGPLACLQASFP